ncbi:MAG TPA: CAP domain-containing protein [Solirubrobacterales bacterium]|nr:CAP domain-containing protein [Solirubrobacterales bacterium]
MVGALIGALSPASAAEARSAERLLAPAKECKGQRSSGMPAALQVRAMVCLHRYARREAGRRSVRVSPMLRRSANLKAADLMRCGGVVSHEPCGHDAFERQAQVGYMKGEFGVGENLAAGDGDAGSPRAMMLAWLRSPLHRRALLTPAFDEIGVALVHDPYPDSTSRQVWVAHLGYRH